MIRNVALSFAKKVISYSHPQFHEQSESSIYTILAKNNFPRPMIFSIINLAKSTPSNTENVQRSNFCSVTYVPGISESLTRRIKNFMPDVTLAHKPENKVGTFFCKQKDKIPNTELSDVVYKINCKDCESIYIGETTQKLQSRIRQHINSSSAVNLPKPDLASALARHCKNHGHSFDFNNVKIVDRHQNKRKLQLSEVNQIIIHLENVPIFGPNFE